MIESSGYQLILAEGRAEARAKGRVEGARKVLLIFGETRFGPSDDAVTAMFDAIDDLDRLKQLGLRMLKAKSWQELLGQPAPRPRSRRKK
jgi:hypothetical protein